MEPTLPTDHDAIQFIVRLARALHNAGTPSHQIEDALALVAVRLGVQAQFMATPTSILISSGPWLSERIHLLRVEPGEQHLGRLADVHQVARAVLRGELAPGAGAEQLEAIERAPQLYGNAITVVAMGLSSAAAARFLGGGPSELITAAFIGVMLGLLGALSVRRPAIGRLFEPLAAFTASIMAGIAATLFQTLSVYLATLAGIIILIPGFTLTVAITELSNRHLAAGTARLFGAFTTFVVIAIGVAIGSRVSTQLFGTPAAATPETLPGWTIAVALLAAPLSFTVLLKAKPRDGFWILATCVLGFYGGRVGAVLLGPELGVFVGAVVVGLAGSAYFSVFKRPPAVVRVPGILMLVPGSVGFRGLTALLDRQVVPGVETAFRMITMAVALAAGLLIASVVAPSRIGK